MKRYFLTLAILFAATIVFAQPGKKPVAKEKAPTNKEMEEMMKEAQKAMDEMSPEDKKMMDSLGIKMPSMKSIPKITDKQLADAYEDEMRIVPVKDNARIASISKTPLTAATLPAFLQSVQEQVSNKLGPSVSTQGENAYQWIKNKYPTSSAVGNAAVGCWMMGKPELALYIMGKACKDDPTDIDNLNNFSALLTMAGAEQLAIPLLNNLNKQFPQNSTILNNIGQAWFGLGDIDRSEKYLDSTIHIYAYHPQANFTKSLIEESKGNKQGAIEAVKRSIKDAYSMEKENRLNKSGYKLKSEDLTWDRPMPQDPLGLEKFKWPDYPMTVGESEIREKEWDAFKLLCNDEINELKQQEKRLEEEVVKANEQLTKQLMQAGQKGIMIDPLPRLAYKAMIKLKYLVDDKDGHLAFAYQKNTEAVATAYFETAKFENTLSSQLEALEKKYEDQFGEGKPNPFGAACADDTKAKNSFLKSSNTLLQTTFTDYINFMRRKINDEMYYYQYTMWSENFELAKVQAQISWLSILKNQKVMFKDKSPWCQDEKEEEPKTFKLSQFEDMHCNYHSELKLGIGTISSDCSKLTAKLDLDFIKLGLKTKQGDRDDESFSDQFQSCSIEVGVKKGVSLGEGPLKIEAKVGAAAFVEFDRKGISDAGVKVSADIKVGTNIIKVQDGTTVIKDNSIKVEPIKGISTLGPSVKDPSISIIGTEAKISVISGFSVSGKGILSGMKK